MRELDKISRGVRVPQRRIQRLKEIKKSDDNLELVEGTVAHPPYLVADGQAKRGEQVQEVRTAINVRLGRTREQDDVECSTHVGRVPNTAVGQAVIDRLNHRFDGKFVTFGNTEQVDRSDAVYTTRRPADWLDKRRRDGELEHHAKTQVIVKPILQKACDLGQPSPSLTHQDVSDAASDIVDTAVDSYRRLQDKFPPIRYFPKPRPSRD